MSKLSPRQRRQSVTRQNILQAARQLVAEAGAESLSMRALAERIDYSPSGLYEYFASKDEIILELLKEGFELLGAELSKVSSQLPPRQRLVEEGLAYLNFASTHPESYSLMFGSTATNRISLDEIREHPVFAVLLETVKAGVAQGEFLQEELIPAEMLAFGCWANVHGLAMLQQIAKSDIRGLLNQYLRRNVEVYVEGIIRR